MIRVTVTMKFTGEILKRVPVAIMLDAASSGPVETYTDRAGIATFKLEPASGKVLVDGVPRYHGHLSEDMHIELWSLADSTSVGESGAPAGLSGGSIAYPSMQTKVLHVEGREVLTDSEGYLVHPEDWSEAFVRTQAAAEGLQLTNEHWDVIRYLRDYFASHNVQAQVREIIRHFRKVWGPERGSNRYLHDIFPRGGPQKQGNRLAGLLRTKGEH